MHALSVDEKSNVSGEKISEKIHLGSDLAAGLLYSLCLGRFASFPSAAFSTLTGTYRTVSSLVIWKGVL